MKMPKENMYQWINTRSKFEPIFFIGAGTDIAYKGFAIVVSYENIRFSPFKDYLNIFGFGIRIRLK